MADEKAVAPRKARRPARPTPKPKPASVPKPRDRISEAEVAIVAKKGRKGKGDGAGGEYWDVTVAGKRAGEVFVNVIDEAPLGEHASLQIFLNRPFQGRGVGSIAYRMAADASRHSTIFLHMRKGNVASRKAAEAAGFVDASPPEIAQLILRRDRG